MYKKGQGTISRIAVSVLGVLIGAYAGTSWYYNYAGGDMKNPTALIGAVVLLLGIGGWSIYIAFFRSDTSDYLIDMDTELRKVVWPAVVPLFDPKTEAWGSTYVVIVCTLIMAAYIGLVDKVLETVVARYLLGWLLTA